jgi:hypothetical protein
MMRRSVCIREAYLLIILLRANEHGVGVWLAKIQSPEDLTNGRSSLAHEPDLVENGTRHSSELEFEIYHVLKEHASQGWKWIGVKMQRAPQRCH